MPIGCKDLILNMRIGKCHNLPGCLLDSRLLIVKQIQIHKLCKLTLSKA